MSSCGAASDPSVFVDLSPARRSDRLWFRQQCWKMFDAIARSQETAYFDFASREFATEREELVALVRSTLREESATAVLMGIRGPASDASLSIKKITGESLAEFLRRVRDRYDAVYHRNWRDRFIAMNTSTTNVVGARLAGEVGIRWNIMNPLIQEEIHRRANLIAGIGFRPDGTPRSIPERTHRAILTSIVEGMREGEGVDGLANRVRQVFDRGLVIRTRRGTRRVLSAPARARLIARTESAAMANGASLRLVQESQLENMVKIWLSQGDDRVRETHLADEADSADGIPLDEDFPNTGMDYPQDFNERCTLIYERRRSRSGADEAGPAVGSREWAEGKVKELEAVESKRERITARVQRRIDELEDRRRRLVDIMEAGGLPLSEFNRLDEEVGAISGILERLWDRKERLDRVALRMMYRVVGPLPGEGWTAKIVVPEGLRTLLSEATNNGESMMNLLMHRRWNTTVNIRHTPLGRGYFLPGDPPKIYMSRNDLSHLAHEIGHQIEDVYKEVLESSIAFLNRRTEGEAARLLADITGISQFGDEVAKPDLFFRAYVGRIYRAPDSTDLFGTEILSMGFEQMVKNPLKFANLDFDHFRYVMTIMHGKLPGEI